jgi:hypothetical protein
LHKRSIGFSALVHQNEHTLFSDGDLGIVDAGVSATKIDLDISTLSPECSEPDYADLRAFIWVNQPLSARALLALVVYNCPTWFEPVRRRLALNDLRWINPITGINNIEDFDPWSQAVLQSKSVGQTLFGF